MQRIDHPSAIAVPQPPLPEHSPGHFRRPSVGAGDQGTIVTGDWAESVQEEIVNAILAAGISLDKAKFDQLSDAIFAVATSRADNAVSNHSTESTESARGHIEAATNDEVSALSNLLRAIRPSQLPLMYRSGGVDLASGFWRQSPDGFIEQWGEKSGNSNSETIILPVPMLNAEYDAHALANTGSDGSPLLRNFTAASFQFRQAGLDNYQIRWGARGYAALQ